MRTVDGARQRPGVGLDNVRNRLSARYGDKFTMTAGSRDPNGFAVEISYPAGKGRPDDRRLRNYAARLKSL